MTIKELYNFIYKEFKSAQIEDYRCEVEYIFEKYFGFTKSDVILKSDNNVSEQDRINLLKILNKRKDGIPLQYILGVWEFMGREFSVGSGVLIPRDDTTVLVQESYKYASKIANPKIIDLCSGTGCIAITLDKNLKNSSEVYGVEKSEKAFRYLKQNAELHESKIKCINADIFEIYSNFRDNFFDMIVSNPPYIKSGDIINLQKEVKKEPLMALDGGEDGLDFYRKISDLWSPKLKAGGMIAFEIGIGQSSQVSEILTNHDFKNIQVIKDISGIDRVVTGIK